jgi:hypothetical protein
VRSRAVGPKDKRSSQRRRAVDTRDKSVRDRAQEAERYRAAAELALDQLQWCINYLYRIRKPALARQLKRNRERSRPIAWCRTRSDGIAGDPTETRPCKPFCGPRRRRRGVSVAGIRGPEEVPATAAPMIVGLFHEVDEGRAPRWPRDRA